MDVTIWKFGSSGKLSPDEPYVCYNVLGSKRCATDAGFRNFLQKRLPDEVVLLQNYDRLPDTLEEFAKLSSPTHGQAQTPPDARICENRWADVIFALVPTIEDGSG